MDLELDLDLDLENLQNVSMDKLTPEQRWRLEHAKMHEEHKGHNQMHAEMLLVLILTLTVAHVLLVMWKKRHFKSYLFVTLIAMWLLPMALCVKQQWWRFIFVWLLFSCTTGLLVRKAVQKPMERTTPRLVYKWFYVIYKISYALGIIGYVIIMMTFFGVNMVLGIKPHKMIDAGFILLFYGLYYGVLGRDLSEICADKMASHIGYYKEEGMPDRQLDPGVCAVCGNRLLVDEDEAGVIENTYKLSCNHVFHEFCIRGWCIIGKKQTCPYCKEKVDLKKMFRNPWERPHVFYGKLLDWVRWLAAWQPLILYLAQGINYTLGLE